MGIFRASRVAAAAAAVPVVPSSPFPTSSQLTPVEVTGLWPADPYAIPPTRDAAMAVPAMSRARHLLCGSIARLPLVAYRGPDRLDPQPSWMFRTDRVSSPFHRMLWTVDDLLFHGHSLWACTRGAERVVLDADRVPYEEWDVDADGHVVDLDGRPYDADAVVYIPGPHEGVLRFGAGTIRAAATLERVTADVARAPFRVELHQTTDDPMTDAEIAALVADARRNLADNGGVLYTNRHLEVRVHTTDPGALLVEGRNAAAVDCARHASVPAALVDATSAGSSLTYETTAGRNAEFVDYGLSLYLAAIESRLSMDDVLPRGQRAVLDLADVIGPAPLATGPVRED